MPPNLTQAGNPTAQAANDGDYPLAGETVGLWRLTNGIGRGGMGEVYASEYDYRHLLPLQYPEEQRQQVAEELAALPREEQGRLVSDMLGTPLPADARFAIKICSARKGTPGYRRFLQEAQLAKRLGGHPHIISVQAIHSADKESHPPAQWAEGRHQDLAYMVMALAERTFDPNRLSIPQAVHVVRCIASALDYAHQCGVIHRDLKPENILGDVQNPQLTDFGIAKEIDHSLELTRTGQIIGTLDYMSPEQATDAKNVDQSSDIYSLGVVLYEFATGGHLPYIHLAEREACLAAIRSARIEPRWPREHVDDFPRGLERIIVKCMNHDRQARYREMSELITDLDRFARGDWINPIGRVQVRSYARLQVRRHPKAVFGLGLILVVLLTSWLITSLLHWADGLRSELDSYLNRYQTALRLVEERQQAQIPADVAEESRDFLAKYQESYPEQWEKFLRLQKRAQEARFLRADFHDPDQVAQKDRLTAAVGGSGHPWHLEQHGLRLTRESKMELGPYGRGNVYCVLWAQVGEAPARFRLYPDGVADRYLEVRTANGQAGMWRGQAGSEQLLAEWKLTDGRLQLYLDAWDEGTLLWIDSRQLRQLPGGVLSAQQGVRLELVLPADSRLEKLEIWPEMSAYRQRLRGQ